MQYCTLGALRYKLYTVWQGGNLLVDDMDDTDSDLSFIPSVSPARHRHCQNTLNWLQFTSNHVHSTGADADSHERIDQVLCWNFYLQNPESTA